MERIGLSGIYIFDAFEGEDKRQPTCIEDCREETRQEWRRGAETEMLPPKLIGEAIDVAIECLTKGVEKNET